MKSPTFRTDWSVVRYLPLLLVLWVAGCDSRMVSAYPKKPLPEPHSPGAKVLKEYCSDCHAPPHPSVHEAREWPNIVHRMQERRRMKAYTLMGEEEIARLNAYLQRHARKEGDQS